jgi:MFS transporter, OPA family, sugar phosphate sensor protein UhpC
MIFQKILNFYKTGPDKPPKTSDPTAIKKEYEHKRLSVFLSITFGYGFFYLCRLSFSVVKKPMLDEGILNTEQMGAIGSALLLTYAFGKFINGFIADRSNIQKFMSTGLLVSAVMNLLLGFTSLFWMFVVLWAINGWFQSMGSAPSVVSISNWFSNKERGTRYGVWSTGHSIGEGMTFIGTAFLVSALGWRWGFWGPGLFCIIVAVLMYIFMHDRPETFGLPAVADYKNDHTAKVEAKESLKAVQLDVLKNPAIWILGLSSASMYVARYGVNNWAILFLQEGKGYSLVAAGSVLSAYPIMGLFGAAVSGLVSDKLFNSKRNMPALIFGLMEIGALTVFLLTPAGNTLIDTAAMAVFGFALGALLCYLGGLMAVDISSKRAAGAAMGLIGMFSYLGAALQDYVSGFLINANKIVENGVTTYNFDSMKYFWIGASILSLLLAASVWKVKAKD